MMTDPETAQLREEIRQFEEEKEKIRMLVGQIGGKTKRRQETVITVLFMALLVVLFVLDACRHLLHVTIPLPPLFSIEIGILLVSLKIIWMIHSQTRVEHFQFWILNSIEFRANDIAKRLKGIEEMMQEQGGAATEDAENG